MSSLIEHFSELEDPRIERNKRHQLMDIIVLTVCAVISGAEGWDAIEEFGNEKIDWLRQYIDLENGIPSDDCIAYVMQRLCPIRFRECFMSWTQSIAQQVGSEVIALDGKTAKGSRDRKHNRNPLHMVSAWACKSRLVLGQQQAEEKSNEITAIPELLRLLALKGCIVTIDAMGCQKAIASQIIEQDGDYVLGLKGNQESMSEAVEDFFITAQAADFKGVGYQYLEEIDKGHGRLETRCYWISACLETLPDIDKWAGLRSIGMVERTCEQGTEVTVEKRYFLCSIVEDAAIFANAVREHWGIENKLHWRLDVTLKEDKSRIRKGNAPAIMTSLRHLSINLFEREGSKMSLAKKMRKAAWNDSFRSKVVFS